MHAHMAVAVASCTCRESSEETDPSKVPWSYSKSILRAAKSLLLLLMFVGQVDVLDVVTPHGLLGITRTPAIAILLDLSSAGPYALCASSLKGQTC